MDDGRSPTLPWAFKALLITVNFLYGGLLVFVFLLYLFMRLSWYRTGVFVEFMFAVIVLIFFPVFSIENSTNFGDNKKKDDHTI